MIDAKDLRIGDLVRYEDATYRVEGLYKRTNGKYLCYINSVDYDVTEEVSTNDVSPIPLTPEILEKNDFMPRTEGQHVKEYAPKRFLSVEYGYDDGCRTFLKQQASPSYVRIGNTNHVHQFQHILWILGEDAEMKV